MVAPRRLKIYLVALVAGALLAACGGAPAAIPPTTAPEPTAKPTSTPRPTAKPEPTAEPTAEPIAEPTAETGELVTQKIDMSDSATYSYKTGIFSIDVPGSWSADDRSSASEVLVRFTDTSENGVVLVNLIESQEQKSEEELVTLLTDYLENTYSKQQKFSHDDAKPQSDGSVLVVWGYDVTLSSGKTVRLLGNSFIEQRDNLVSLLTLALPDEQFDGLKPNVDTILNSYKIDSSIAIDAAAAATTTTGELQPVEIGDLETYNYKTGLFSIDVPKNWSFNDNSKPGEAILLWTDPSQNGLVVVDVFEEQTKQSADELVAFLRDFLNKSFKSEQDFTMNDPKEQSDGSQLIVWSYTATASGDVKSELLGNSFIEQRGNKVSILSMVVPSDQFDALQPSTNKIINSYKVDPSSDLP